MAIDSYSLEGLPTLHLPHFEADKIRAVDWDGTMGVVSKNVERLKEEAAPYGVSPDQIEASKSDAKTHDGFFDPLSDVENILDDKQFTAFGNNFIGVGDGRATLYDDAGNFLVRAEEANAPIIGVTHGKNPLWQFGKVSRGLCEARQNYSAGGYLYTEVMTGPKEKGPHVQDWQGPDGTFDVAGLDENGQPVAIIHGRSVEVIDDRNYSHDGLPPAPQGSGVLVKRDSAPASRRLEGVPSHLQDRVRTVRGLGDISIAPSIVSAYRRQALPGNIVAFRPIYMPGKDKPGMLLTPRTSFGELRVASRRQMIR